MAYTKTVLRKGDKVRIADTISEYWSLIFDGFRVEGAAPDPSPPPFSAAQESALSATIAARVNRGQRSANFIAVLSDSIGKGVYEGDYEEGIDGSGTTSAGASWLTFAAALSGGKIVRAVNASVIGNTTTQMRARVQADVIDHPSAPAACVVMGGYNDAEQGLAVPLTPAAIFATYITNVTKIVETLQAGGVVPILATPLPTDNNATIADTLVKMALWTRRYAAQQGIALVDFQAFATDPATGGLKASIKAGGDGVHPGIDGQFLLGQFFADQISPSLPPYKIPLVSSPLDVTNLIPNGLFTGTPTDGKAPSVFQWGSLPAGVANSITTDSLVAGSLQRVTHTASTAEAVLAQRIQQSGGKWSPGDRIAFSGIITASGMGARIETDFNAPPYGLAPIRFATGITRGYWHADVVVPAGIAVDYIDVKLISGPGTGYVEFGQLTAYNLTKLGLV